VLAQEIGAGTIEKVLAKTTLELGIEVIGYQEETGICCNLMR
jgi:hypothetical protein